MSERPLAGVTVVEIGHSVAAPYAGMVLAELGAEVIKVERPGSGDPARDWGPPYNDGAATAFSAFNRSKHGITIDFGDPAQLARLKELILTRADVVLQNLRAGAARRAGLGADELCERKPELIYASIHAFGSTGPLKDRPGYDPLMQAFGGLMAITGEGGGRMPVRVAVSIIDIGTALWTVIGVLAALARRSANGKGGTIDTSLFETALAWMLVPLMTYAASGELRRPMGSATAEIAPYQAFPTASAPLMVAAGNDRLFRALCEVLERPELAQDERYRTNGARNRNRAELIAQLEELFRRRTADEWAERLLAAGVPHAPILNEAQVLAHPQTAALGIIQAIAGASVPFVGLPLSLDGSRPTVRSPAPALGADNATVIGRAAKE